MTKPRQKKIVAKTAKKRKAVKLKRTKLKDVTGWVYKLPDIDELPPFQFRPSALFFPVFPTKKKARGYENWLNRESQLNLPAGEIIRVRITPA